MQQYFEQYGGIQEIRIYFEELKNKCYKGYGFILFRSEKGMAKALKLGNSHTIKDVTFECKQSLLKNELEQINKFTDEEDQRNLNKGKSKTSIDGKLSIGNSKDNGGQADVEYVPKSKLCKGSGIKLNTKSSNFELNNPLETSLIRKQGNEKEQDIMDGPRDRSRNKSVTKKIAFEKKSINKGRENYAYQPDQEELHENDDYMGRGEQYPGRNSDRGSRHPGYQQGQVPPPQPYYKNFEAPYNYRGPPPPPRADYDPYYYPPSHPRQPYHPHQLPPPQHYQKPRIYNKGPSLHSEGYEPGKSFKDERAYFAHQQLQDAKKDHYYYEKTSSSSNKSGNYAHEYHFYNDPYQRHRPPHYNANSAPYWNRPPSQADSVYYGNHQRANSHFMGQPGGPLKGFQPQRKMVMKTLTEYKGHQMASRNLAEKGPRTEYPSSKPRIPKETHPSKEQLSTHARDTEELFNREKDNTMNIFDLEDNDGLSAIFDPSVSSSKNKKTSKGVKPKTEGFNLQKLGCSESQIDKLEGELKPEKLSQERRTEVVKSLAKVDFEDEEFDGGSPGLVVEKPEEEERESEENQSSSKKKRNKDIKFSDDEDYEERRREITCLDFGL